VANDDLQNLRKFSFSGASLGIQQASRESWSEHARHSPEHCITSLLTLSRSASSFSWSLVKEG
jgi:hypothetical protein